MWTKTGRWEGNDGQLVLNPWKEVVDICTKRNGRKEMGLGEERSKQERRKVYRLTTVFEKRSRGAC